MKGPPLLQVVLRWFFHLLYNPFAWAYDLVAAVVSGGRWWDWAFCVLPYLEGQRVLELGFGSGHLLKRMSELGVTAYGIDASYSMSRVCGRLMGGLVGVNWLVINGYAQYLPFPSNHFHQVVATFPTDFLWQPLTVQQIYRVLIPGGKLIALPSVWITGKRPYERFLAWLYKFTGQSLFEEGHAEQYITRPFAQVGFQVWVERIRHKSGTLLLMQAQKPGPVEVQEMCGCTQHFYILL
ncbi:MAG: methyltransferase domain-containing protein [Chloroflexota bacterium]